MGVAPSFRSSAVALGKSKEESSLMIQRISLYLDVSAMLKFRFPGQQSEEYISFAYVTVLAVVCGLHFYTNLRIYPSASKYLPATKLFNLTILVCSS